MRLVFCIYKGLIITEKNNEYKKLTFLKRNFYLKIIWMKIHLVKHLNSLLTLTLILFRFENCIYSLSVIFIIPSGSGI